jgi:Fe-S-cluster containining protein
MHNHLDECKQCGNCCKQTVPLVSKEDIARWKKEGRQYILDNIEEHHIWHRVKALEDGACTFYNGQDCIIHNTKPGSCRSFPHSIDAGKKVKCKIVKNK